MRRGHCESVAQATGSTSSDCRAPLHPVAPSSSAACTRAQARGSADALRSGRRGVGAQNLLVVHNTGRVADAVARTHRGSVVAANGTRRQTARHEHDRTRPRANPTGQAHDSPVVARRRDVQLCCSPCNFAKGPLTRTPIQLKKISRHPVPFLDKLLRLHPYPPGPKQPGAESTPESRDDELRRVSE